MKRAICAARRAALGLPPHPLRATLLLAAALLAAPACQRPEEAPAPADLLPQAQMAPLLADIHVLESRVEGARLTPDSAQALFGAQKVLLLRRHQVSDSAFQRSYRYYSIHGKDLDALYAAVIDTLVQRKKRLGGIPAPASPALSPPPGHKLVD